MITSSLVIHSKPNEFETVKNKLSENVQIEIIDSMENKIAVVLETESTEEAVNITNYIRTLEGVAGLEVASHFFEDESLDN